MYNTILEKILHPISIGDFFKNYWEQHFIHIQHGAGYFDDIITITDLDDFLSNQGMHPDGMRVVKDGKDVHPDDWSRSDRLVSGKIRTVITPDKLFELYNQGSTLVLNVAERIIPRLADACRAFEQQLKIKVQSNIYITPANSQGFGKHYDTHDIFTMQIKGPKTWRIYDTGEELPTKNQPFKNEPVLIKVLQMNAGDLLYLPRGTVHEAFSSDVATIGVNFSCKPRHGFNLVEELAKIVESEDAFFRKTIPNGLQSEEDKKKYLQQFNEKLAQMLSDDMAERLLESQYQYFISNQTLYHHNKFTELLYIDKLNLDTTLSRYKNAIYSIKNMDAGTEISFGNKKLVVPKMIDKALFLQDTPFKINDIKGLISNNGKLEIARQFIAAGYFGVDSY